jgi:hypothetical protein
LSEYIETWKSIGAHLGRSERWCRYMARRPRRPLPAFRYGGVIRLNLGTYRQWLEDEEREPLGSMSAYSQRTGGIRIRTREAEVAP